MSMSDLPTVLLHGLDTLRPDVEAVLDGVRPRWIVAEPSALELPTAPSGQPPVVLVADGAARVGRHGRNPVEDVVRPDKLDLDLAPAVSKAVLRDVLRRQVVRARADCTMPEAVRATVLHLLESDRRISIGRLAVETGVSCRTLRRQWATWRGVLSGEPSFSDIASSVLALRVALRRIESGDAWARVADGLGMAPATLRRVLERWLRAPALPASAAGLCGPGSAGRRMAGGGRSRASHGGEERGGSAIEE